MKYIIEKIFEYEQLAINKIKGKKTFERNFKIDWNNEIIGFTGLRGVGKTTLMLNKRIETNNSLYFSCDFEIINAINLFELIKEINKTYKISVFFIDEIHKYSNWKGALKNIFDLLNVKIIFSGSSMIDILKGSYDLSRRVIIYKIPIFSFYEFLNINKKIQCKSYSLIDLIKNHIEIAKENSIWYSKIIFEEYLEIGQFGYFIEHGDKISYYSKLYNSIKKSIYEDLVNFVDISTENIKKFEEILFFIANSISSETNINSISKKTSLNNKTIEQYLKFLEDLGWIVILNKYGNISDMIRKQKKILFTNTNINFALKISINENEFIGNLRETFFISSINKIKNDKLSIFFETKEDFIIDYEGKKYIFEIGGKNKKTNSNKITLKDDIIIGNDKIIPLWLFGLVN